VIVRLKDPPLAQYEGGIPGLRATSPKATGTARLNLSAPESRAYLDYLASVQEQFVRDLASVIPEAQVQRQYRVVLNGFAVKVPRNKVELIRTMPGVASVTVEREYHLDMDASLPLIGLVNDQNGNGFDPTDPDQGLWTLVGGHNRAGQGLKTGLINALTNAQPGQASVWACGGCPVSIRNITEALLTNDVERYTADGMERPANLSGMIPVFLIRHV
jgi:hypothetical protein